MKRKLEKIQKWNFKLAFRFGKILKIINARCGRRRFLRFWSTWSGVGHPEMPPSCLELNSDDFPFFRNLSSTSGTRDSFFGSLNKKSSSSSSRLIKRNENSNPHPLSARWWIKRRRQKSQMLPISSQSLNGANSASRRAREVPKKRKIIRI